MIKLSQPQIPESAIEKVGDILRSGQLVHGEECNLFEKELAEFLGAKHALVVSNGTAALHLALLALNIGPGDAVIVPDFTFTATANIVEAVGAKAIIVDVNKASYNLDPKKLISCIENWQGPEELKAIMPVLEFGNPKDVNTYKNIAEQYNMHMIEDAACALGAYENGKKVGTVGDFGCFSFHPRKTLTTGEGGALVTDDDYLFRKASLLRNHGMEKNGSELKFKCVGLNYRLTNFQGAIGRALLKSLNDWIDVRRSLAKIYLDLLQKVANKGDLTLPTFEAGHTFQTFMVVLNEKYDRSIVISKLKEYQIESNLGAQSMSCINLFNHKNNFNENFNEGQRLYKKGLALPLHEGMSEKDVIKVVDALENILSSC